MKEEGKFRIGEDPEIVSRFIKVCEAFREAHRGKEEKVFGNRINYCIGAATLEAHETENTRFFKLTGVGAFKKIYDEGFYEINPDSLAKFENMFIAKEQDFSSDFGM